MAIERTGRRTEWSWRDGVVDGQGDYLELRYGSQGTAPETWVSVARVGRPRGREFPVAWQVDRRSPANQEMVNATMDELNYFLLELGERDPWEYAQYHCGTISNWYGSVHWACRGRSEPLPKQRRKRRNHER